MGEQDIDLFILFMEDCSVYACRKINNEVIMMIILVNIYIFCFFIKFSTLSCCTVGSSAHLCLIIVTLVALNSGQNFSSLNPIGKYMYICIYLGFSCKCKFLNQWSVPAELGTSTVEPGGQSERRRGEKMRRKSASFQLTRFLLAFRLTRKTFFSPDCGLDAIN